MTRKSELTRSQKRASLGTKLRVSCRFCPGKFENFDQLRFHAQTEHPIITRTVNRQLGQVDAKLRILESLAEEGMRGCKEDVTSNRANQWSLTVLERWLMAASNYEKDKSDVLIEAA